jgi:hypothetical protein
MSLNFTIGEDAGNLQCFILYEGDELIGVFHALPRNTNGVQSKLDELESIGRARAKMNTFCLDTFGMVPKQRIPK